MWTGCYAMSECKAIQYSDQMCCGRCGLAWDVNDPEPPECLTEEELRRRKGREALDKIKEKMDEEESRK